MRRLSVRFAALTLSGCALVGFAVGSSASANGNGTRTVIQRCADVNESWTASTSLELGDGVLTLEWESLGEAVTLSTRDLDCENQAGLREYVMAAEKLQADTRRDDCVRLKAVVQQLRKRLPSARGRVQVTAADDAAVSKVLGSVAGFAGFSDHHRPRSVDLVVADDVLSNGC